MNNSLAEVHPELVSEWSEKNKIKPTEVSIGSHKKVIWRCEKGHEWEAAVKSRTINKTDADVLICGGSGGGAQTALAAAGINLFGGVSGDVDKAVEAFINETLEYNPDGLIIFLSLLVESDG